METVTLLDLIDFYKPFKEGGKELKKRDMIYLGLDDPEADKKYILEYMKKTGRDNVNLKGAIQFIIHLAAEKYYFQDSGNNFTIIKGVIPD